MTCANFPGMPAPSAFESTFESAIRPHLSTLRGLARRLTGTPDQAEDLVQDTLTRAWKHWHRLDDRDMKLRAWLRRVMVNTFISSRRHHAVVRRTAARPDLVDHLVSAQRRRAAAQPETVFRGRQRRTAVLEMLEELEEPFKTAVVMVDLHGSSYREVSETLGCPVGTVMSRLHRGRARLRARIQADTSWRRDALC